MTVEDVPPRKRPNHAARLLGALAAVVLVVVGGTGAYVLAQNRSEPSAPVVTPIPPLLPGAPALTTPPPAAPASVPVLGFDVSHPQCSRVLPDSGGFGIVGINGGRPLSSNPCLAKQVRWAAGKKGHAVYVNTGYPGTGDPVGYGRHIVDDAIAREHAAGVSGTTVWWLDVETVNTWEGTPRENATVLDAMAAHLQELGVRVGIYSTPSMWVEIAGTWEPGLPVWYATGPGTQASAAVACGRSFAGSSTAIVQWVPAAGGGWLDHDMVCPAFADRAGELFDLG